MAPTVSKLSTAFPADEMVGLLKFIDNNIQEMVRTLRGQGAEVRGKVKALIQKYVDLIADILRECMYFRNFIKIIQRNLEGIENILTLVLKGSVSEILADLRLEKYLSVFEKEDLINAVQLMQTNFDIEQVNLPTKWAKEAIHDRIQDYRLELMTVKDRIQEVKEEGEKCHQSCQEITQRLKMFFREIDEIQEAIISLLGDQHAEKGRLTAKYMTTGGIALTCLVLCVTGGAQAGLTCLGVTLEGAASAVVTGTLGIGCFGASAAVVDIGGQLKEVEKIKVALEDLKGQTTSMTEDASKQKIAWQEIQTQAEKIVHYIDNSKMEKTADALKDPRRRTPVQEVLDGVHDVLEDVAILQDNIVRFKKEAASVQDSLVKAILMKDTDGVLTSPGEKSTSLLQSLGDLITGTVKALKMTSEDGRVSQVMALKSLKLE
ncbi:PREDICTED: uncharacterized protein LOC109486617 [Branchiostoma belcheri]|uniref:Uncharacterized protein LOC109486617 n=1 Tax=Branchiostoma belcheri TaxID=7741 RepID=A0A6P4ZXY7_BRABE|nr:PREDICTED: uncharacterized protein LOC109486617 [Branchiostoma belcheri]